MRCVRTSSVSANQPKLTGLLVPIDFGENTGTRVDNMTIDVVMRVAARKFICRQKRVILTAAPSPKQAIKCRVMITFQCDEA